MIKEQQHQTRPHFSRFDAILSVTCSVLFVIVNFKEAAVFSHEFRLVSKGGLLPGWLPWVAGGGEIDLKDAQYHSWRDNIPLMVTAVVAGSKFCESKRSGNLQYRWRIWYYATFSFIFIVVCHGTDVAYLFMIITINYMLSEMCIQNSKEFRMLGKCAVWIFACTVIIMNERRRGYGPFRFSQLPVLGPLTGFLDGYPGLTPWHHRFPLVMLRMISFSMDRSWSVSPVEELGKAQHSHRDLKRGQIETPNPKEYHPQSCYSFQSYFAYLFYPPLYIAGPIMTFNSFVTCVTKPDIVAPSTVQKVLYGFRTLICFITLEVFLHYMYINSIVSSWYFSKLLNNPLWCIVFGYMAVKALYLKFLVIWRFFRFWAICDNVIPPENMPQCITATTTISNFWKGWHSSFNKWLVRYIYIPMGGNSPLSRKSLRRLDSKVLKGVVSTTMKLFNIAAVFTFVAVWHDQKLALLAWSWVLIASMVPELFASFLLGTPVGQRFAKHWAFRYARALGGVFCISTLIAANVIGFSAGVDGTGALLKKSLWSSKSMSMFANTFVVLYGLALGNFQYRAWQARHS